VHPFLIPASSSHWDCLCLGEVMLRFDPGDRRIATTRNFQIWEGGGEYNVARGLRRCFGLRTAIASALADNSVGRLVEDLILQGGVDTSLLRWIPYDGVGRNVRNGLNFVERGFGQRAAAGCSDRGHTAISQVKTGDFDWATIFGTDNATKLENSTKWFHTGGIFAALSSSTAAVAAEAMETARRHGIPVSYDPNYRESLWKSLGGVKKATEVNRSLVSRADLLFGNAMDYASLLEIEPPSTGTLPSPEEHERLMRKVLDAFPNLKMIAGTLRTTLSATRNTWGAVACTQKQFCCIPPQEVEIYDRVGGGDGFASGVLYGLLTGQDVDRALRYGVAHGTLAMTTPGDSSMATLREVEALMQGDPARISR